MLVSSKREVKRWSVRDEEVLRHETVDCAVEDFLDALDVPGGEPLLRATLEEMGEIEVTGYAQVQIDISDLGERLLMDADDRLAEFANPDDGGPTAFKADTCAAARQLAKLVLRDFWVWQMEPVTSIKVNALEWVEAYAPHWLKTKQPHVWR
jgi:hypothetical protein